MRHFSFIQTAACAALLLVAFSPRFVRADQWDKRTVVSFSDTVQVPGTTLPAGTYVFKLAESSAERFVVQVFNEREDHIFATLLAIPDYHMTTPEKTIISFYEAPPGQPEPIKAWFYPGDNLGREFVYSKSEAALIAQAGNQAVQTGEPTAVALNARTQDLPAASPVQSTAAAEPAASQETTTDDTHAAEPVPAQVAAQPEPQPQHESIAPNDDTTSASTAAEDQPSQPAQDGAAPANPDTTSLPATGSELPMVALIGLLSIAGAVAIRAARCAS
jgi:hypothetical protein